MMTFYLQTIYSSRLERLASHGANVARSWSLLGRKAGKRNQDPPCIDKNSLLRIWDIYDTALCLRSFGSFTTVTYNSFSPSPNAMFVVPSPAAILNTYRSLPSGDIFKILPPNHWAT